MKQKEKISPQCWKQFRALVSNPTSTKNRSLLLLSSQQISPLSLQSLAGEASWRLLTGQWKRTVPSLKCLSAKLQSNDKSPHGFFQHQLNSHRSAFSTLGGNHQKKKRNKYQEGDTTCSNKNIIRMPQSYQLQFFSPFMHFYVTKQEEVRGKKVLRFHFFSFSFFLFLFLFFYLYMRNEKCSTYNCQAIQH